MGRGVPRPSPAPEVCPVRVGAGTLVGASSEPWQPRETGGVLPPPGWRELAGPRPPQSLVFTRCPEGLCGAGPGRSPGSRLFPTVPHQLRPQTWTTVGLLLLEVARGWCRADVCHLHRGQSSWLKEARQGSGPQGEGGCPSHVPTPERPTGGDVAAASLASAGRPQHPRPLGRSRSRPPHPFFLGPLRAPGPPVPTSVIPRGSVSLCVKWEEVGFRNNVFLPLFIEVKYT